MLLLMLGLLMLFLALWLGPTSAFAGMTIIFVATMRQSAQDARDRRPMRRR